MLTIVRNIIPIPVRRMGVFALMPVLSVLSNVILLPVISHLFGTSGWTSVLIGQGIGAAASVVVSLQWMSEGPALVAQSEHRFRGAILRASTRARALALVGVSPLLVAGTFIAGPADVITCLLASLAAATIGLSPNWYYVGIGRPARLVLLEGVPRLLGNGVALGLLLLGAPLWSFPAVMLLTALGATGGAWRAESRQHRSQRWHNPQGRRATGLATLARSLDAGSVFLAGPVVATLVPAAYPLFGACDRLCKVLLSGLSVVPQGAVGWISEPADASVRNRRAWRITLLLVPLAALIAVVLAVATPLLVQLLFAGTVDVPYSTSALAALSVAMIFLGQATFYSGLAPTGQAASGYRYLTVAAMTGVPAVVIGALTLGANGALAGLALQGAVLWLLSLRRAHAATHASATDDQVGSNADGLLSQPVASP